MTDLARPAAPDISVVIPTIGRDLLRSCLLSLVEGTVWPSELIVVDQSRNPQVTEWVAEASAVGISVRHIHLNQRGIARATNAGLKVAGTPWVAVTHDDCEVTRDWLEKLVTHTRTVEDVVITGRVEARGDGVVVTVKTTPEPARYTRPLLKGDVLFPLNMALPIRIVQRVGYFDEHPSLAFAGEDNDWSHRALRSGVPIVYDPEAVVYHIAWQDEDDLYPMYRRYAYGQGSFYGKHLRRGDLFIALRALRDLARAPWLWIRGVLTRNGHLTAMGRGEVQGLAPGIIAGIRRRPEPSERTSRNPGGPSPG